MLPGRVSNPGPLTYESGAQPIALRGPVGSATRSLIYYLKIKIPEFRSFTSKLYVKGFQEL